jgi:hypothetical protein
MERFKTTSSDKRHVPRNPVRFEFVQVERRAKARPTKGGDSKASQIWRKRIKPDQTRH